MRGQGPSGIASIGCRELGMYPGVLPDTRTSARVIFHFMCTPPYLSFS